MSLFLFHDLFSYLLFSVSILFSRCLFASDFFITIFFKSLSCNGGMTRNQHIMIMLLAGCAPPNHREQHTIEQKLPSTTEEHTFAENASILHAYLTAHDSFYQQHDEHLPTTDYNFYDLTRIRYADFRSWSKKLLDGASQFLLGESGGMK